MSTKLSCENVDRVPSRIVLHEFSKIGYPPAVLTCI